jgi:hypothetical protein
MSDWIVLSKKNGKKGAKGVKIARNIPTTGQPKLVVLDSDVEETLDVPEFMIRLKYLKEDLRGSLFYKEMLEKLKNRRDEIGHRDAQELHEGRDVSDVVASKTKATVRIVAFGIGKFTSNEVSLLQLALLMCLLDDEVDCGSEEARPKSYIFDPMCGEKERMVCSALNIETLEENTNGKFDAMEFDVEWDDKNDGGDKERLTLFYMPHCPYSLYGNVLWRNWGNLGSLSILGNSFDSYSLRRETGSSSECDCVRLLHPYVTELEMWCSSHTDSRKCNKTAKLKVMESAFNDLSLMFFSGDKVEPVKLPDRPPEGVLDEWNKANDPEAIV